MRRRARVAGFVTWAGGAFGRSVGSLALMSLPLALGAQQIRSSVVLGGVRVRYAEAVDVSAITLAPAVTMQSGMRVLGASGMLSRPTLGTWSAQATLAGSMLRPIGHRVAAEFAANLGGSTAGDGTRTGAGQALVRGHLLGARTGAWVGAGAGTAWNGNSWAGTRVTEVGAWTQWDALGAMLSWTPTAANDSVRYADALLSLRWRGTRLEVDGTLGHRSGTRRAVGVNDPSDWASANASYRVSDRVALVFGAGRYPLDLLQGFPAGRFTSFGLRLTGPGRGAAPEFARRADDLAIDQRSRAGVTVVRVRRVSAGRFVLRLRATGASRVETTGDLTGWEPVAMQPEPDGWWRLEIEGRAGLYEITVRRDGGAWFVPAGMLERRDEFGGVSGLLRLR